MRAVPSLVRHRPVTAETEVGDPETITFTSRQSYDWRDEVGPIITLAIHAQGDRQRLEGSET